MRGLTNLAHLDFLCDLVVPPVQPGHSTYRLHEEPRVGVLWTYAEPDADGAFRRVGGGALDPETGRYEQGAFNADDIARAAVVYLRHWRWFADAHSRDRAYGLLRGLAYLQTVAGRDAGNVVLWMQPDGTLNPSAEPFEAPDPSDSGPSYWLARTLWAFGEGYAAFRAEDPDFGVFLADRMDLALDAVERQVLCAYGETKLVDGLEWPAWLIADGADASAEALYGLVAAVEAGVGPRARRAAEQLAEGIAALALGDARTWPFGAIMPWASSRSVWHAWADQMAGALATAGRALGRPDWVEVAIGEAGRLTPHLLVQGGPDSGWHPAPADRSQIAYGADATLQNLLAVEAAAHRESFRELAGIAATWYFGNNPAGVALYDPATGRTQDGVWPDGTVNANSGAESTIHGLLSMMALDRHPEIAARARVATPVERVSWQMLESEAGGQAVTAPAYAELGPGEEVALPVHLPAAGGYLLFAAVDRQEVPEGTVATLHSVGSAAAGRVDHGGAGPQGDGAVPGHLDMVTLQPGGELPQGPATVTARYDGDGTPARLDALLVQPEVEWLVLAGDGEGQALLRSFATDWQRRTVEVPGHGPILARAYDERGILTRATPAEAAIPIAPGGFTVVTRGRSLPGTSGTASPG